MKRIKTIYDLKVGDNAYWSGKPIVIDQGDVDLIKKYVDRDQKEFAEKFYTVCNTDELLTKIIEKDGENAERVLKHFYQLGKKDQKKKADVKFKERVEEFKLSHSF